MLRFLTNCLPRQILNRFHKLCLRAHIDNGDLIPQEANRLSSLFCPTQNLLMAYITKLFCSSRPAARVTHSWLISNKFNHSFRDTIDSMCLVTGGVMLRSSDIKLLAAMQLILQPNMWYGEQGFPITQHSTAAEPNPCMLYGDERLTHDQSRQILESTSIFIHTSLL